MQHPGVTRRHAFTHRDEQGMMHYAVLKGLNNQLCLFIAGCGGIFDLTESNPSVNISSPNYPENYDNLRECTWQFKVMYV